RIELTGSPIASKSFTRSNRSMGFSGDFEPRLVPFSSSLSSRALRLAVRPSRLPPAAAARPENRSFNRRATRRFWTASALPRPLAAARVAVLAALRLSAIRALLLARCARIQWSQSAVTHRFNQWSLRDLNRDLFRAGEPPLHSPYLPRNEPRQARIHGCT